MKKLKKSRKKKIKIEPIAAAMVQSPYANQPWPKNRQGLVAMLDDAKSYGYHRGASEKEVAFKRQMEADKLMIHEKKALLMAHNQMLQAMAEAVRASTYILNGMPKDG